MQAYKRLRTARKAAGPYGQIVIAGDFYIVGMGPFAEFCVLDKDELIVGSITVKHLKRLGNANHAVQVVK